MGTSADCTALAQALHKRRQAHAADLLQYRYDVGKIALALVEKKHAAADRRYGSHIVGDVASELVESLSVIYACLNFVKMVRPKELEDFKAKAWPWRGVVALCTIDDSALREDLKARYEAGEFKTTDELRDAARQIKRKLRLERRRT